MTTKLLPLSMVLIGALLLLAACDVDTTETTTDRDTLEVSDSHLDDLRSDIRDRLDTASSDINRLEQRAETAHEDHRDDIRSSAEDYRDDHQDLEERLAEAENEEDRNARLDSYESIQSDAADLQRRVERSILESAGDADTLAEDTRSFMSRVDGKMQYAEGDTRDDLDEQRQEINQKLGELVGVSQDRFEELRDDISSSYSDLRRDANDAYLDHAHDRERRYN